MNVFKTHPDENKGSRAKQLDIETNKTTKGE